MTELERLLETPVPVVAPVLCTLLAVVLGYQVWQWYRWWQFGRTVRAAALKAIKAEGERLGYNSKGRRQ